MERCLSHLLWIVCNSRPQSHSGSREMGPGTEQQTQRKTVQSVQSFNRHFKITRTDTLETCFKDLPWSSGKETWLPPAAERACWSFWRVRSPRYPSSAEGWCSPTAPTPAGDSGAPLETRDRHKQTHLKFIHNIDALPESSLHLPVYKNAMKKVDKL